MFRSDFNILCIHEN